MRKKITGKKRMSTEIIGIDFPASFRGQDPRPNEKNLFDPCENRKDRLTDGSLQDLQRLRLFDELEP
jgi:hypothetical protein